MSIYCTAQWHQVKQSEYCDKCGERKDRRLSLAGVAFGELLFGVYAKRENQPAVKLRLLRTTKQGSDFIVSTGVLTGEVLSITVNDFHMWMIMDYCLPFQVIVMSLDKDGQGPETDPIKIVRTVYEVWDATCQTVGSFEVRDQAELHLLKLR